MLAYIDTRKILEQFFLVDSTEILWCSNLKCNHARRPAKRKRMLLASYFGEFAVAYKKCLLYICIYRSSGAEGERYIRLLKVLQVISEDVTKVHHAACD